MKFKENQFNKGFKTKYITIKRMRTKSNIETKCKGMKKKLDKWFKTRYTIIKKNKDQIWYKNQLWKDEIKKKLTQQTNEGQIHYIQNNDDQI